MTLKDHLKRVITAEHLNCGCFNHCKYCILGGKYFWHVEERNTIFIAVQMKNRIFSKLFTEQNAALVD